MANAAMDRIINKSYRIILDGESYRKNFTPKYDFGGDKSDKKIYSYYDKNSIKPLNQLKYFYFNNYT